jgi:chromosome segregation ATPase
VEPSDILQHLESIFGTAGAAFAAYIAKIFRSTRMRSIEALALAKAAVEEAKAARAEAKTAHDSAQASRTVVRDLGTRLRDEIRHVLSQVDDKLERMARPSSHDIAPAYERDRKLDELRDRLGEEIKELRGELLRERAARHALERDIAESQKESERLWRDLNRTLGQLEQATKTLDR